MTKPDKDNTRQREEAAPDELIPENWHRNLSPEERAREAEASRLIHKNLEKALSLEEVQPILDELIEICRKPENRDIDIVFTLLFEINHELLVRGSKLENAEIPDDVLKDATITAAKTIRDDLKKPCKREPYTPPGDEIWEVAPENPKKNDPAPKKEKSTKKAAPAEPQPKEPKPATATAGNEIKAQVIRASSMLVPFDPVTRKILAERPAARTDPQTFSIETYKGKKASKGHKAIPPGIVQLTLGLDNESLQKSFPDGAPVHVSDKYEYFDFRVSLAMDALWNKAIEMGTPKDGIYYSVAEVCRHMTSSKAKPAKAQIEKVCKTAEKLMFMRVRIDTEGEAHLRNHSRTRVAAFLPAELEIGRINGNVTALIHPYKEMPVFAFARERGQFTTIPIEIFNESPLSLTDRNIQIEYYLLTRVSKINYSKTWEPTILFDTFLEECEILPPASEDKAAADLYRQHKRRALEAAEKWLAHLVTHGIIKKAERKKDHFKITPKGSKTKPIVSNKKY